MTIGDPRAEVAGARAAETFTGKDPGKGHFYISIVKSVFRLVGCVIAMNMTEPRDAIIALALAFFIAEVLGIGEELI